MKNSPYLWSISRTYPKPFVLGVLHLPFQPHPPFLPICLSSLEVEILDWVYGYSWPSSFDLELARRSTSLKVRRVSPGVACRVTRHLTEVLSPSGNPESFRLLLFPFKPARAKGRRKERLGYWFPQLPSCWLDVSSSCVPLLKTTALDHGPP